MKMIKTILVIGGLFTASLASAATYQYCSTDGCRIGGNVNVTSTYAKTKYPIVLTHGAGGFSAIGGSLDYWYGIPQDLTANGANVFVVQQASLDSSEVRGEQLLNQVEQIRAITGAQKVNLIGHSHGVPSIRYVAALVPNEVASVTGIAGTNLGSPVADMLAKIPEIPVVGDLLFTGISSTLNAFFGLVDTTSGKYYSNDSKAALYSMTTEGAAAFNVKFPQAIPKTPCGAAPSNVNGVRYYSWTGNGVKTNALDPVDYVFAGTSQLIPGPNDGLVGRCSSYLGQVIGDNYNQNHFDEVNQTFGLVGLFQNPKSLFRVQVNRLKLAGL